MSPTQGTPRLPATPESRKEQGRVHCYRFQREHGPADASPSGLASGTVGEYTSTALSHQDYGGLLWQPWETNKLTMGLGQVNLSKPSQIIFEMGIQILCSYED